MGWKGAFGAFGSAGRAISSAANAGEKERRAAQRGVDRILTTIEGSRQ